MDTQSTVQSWDLSTQTSTSPLQDKISNCSGAVISGKYISFIIMNTLENFQGTQSSLGQCLKTADTA